MAPRSEPQKPPKIRRQRPRKTPVLKPYVELAAPARRIARVLFPIGLGFFCLVYGFYFALTVPYLIVPFALPIVLLMLLSIWALPDRPHAPTKAMEFLFSALLISLVVWPNYLALALPGLPWITALRLTGFPMAFFLLICLSISEDFRTELQRMFEAVPGFWKIFAVFVVMQFITVLLSKEPSAAISRAVLQQINWTGVMVVCAWVCLKPGRAERYVGLILLLALPIIPMTIIEFREQHVLWSQHVPSFLKVDDPVAALILSSAVRGATGLYRAKATFSTPLGLAEFLALLTPFALHVAVSGYKPVIRLGCALALPLIFYCIRLTDARLGVVGFFVSVLLYLLFWGLLRLRRNRGDLVAAAVVYAYPAVFGLAVAAILSVRRLNIMVFGDGAQAASNEARQNQLEMGVPKIFANPIGHGPGGSGPAMGYGADAFITIDNYYLSIGLDYGVIGLTMFLAIFLLAIGHGVRTTMLETTTRDRELSLVIPLTIALSAFLVIKLVFSQQDNHPLVYAMLGMLIALVHRAQVEGPGGAASAIKPGHRGKAKARDPQILRARNRALRRI